MKIHVVIPSAGLGTRFNGSEFLELKPFIHFFGKTMLEHLIINTLSSKHNVRISIIIQEKFKNQYIEDINHMEKTYNCKFYYIDKLTEGTTATALHIYDELNNDDFTLLMNCDQIIDISLDDYVDTHIKNNAFGSLLCFTGEDSKKWSFVEEENNIVKRVVAKDNISDVAVCGWYAWSRGKDFIKYGIQQIINQDKVNGEYYLCPVYNYVLKSFGIEHKIYCYKISKDRMHGVGTPDDLKEYILCKQN